MLSLSKHERVAQGKSLPFLLALVLVIARAGTVPAQPTSEKTAVSAKAAAVEQRLVQAARQNPDSFEARYQLASFYLQQKKLQAALPHLQRACAIDPAYYASGHDFALALLDTGKLEEARAQIAQMMRATDTAELHNLLGNVEERAGNFAAADEQ